MEWKVGDQIRFIEPSGDCDEDVFTIDEIYTIETVRGTMHKEYAVTNDGGEHWWIETDAFEFYKKKVWEQPKNELEFLDRVRQNFKYGV